MKRIWILKVGEPLLSDKEAPTLRTGMLCRELAKRGHDVTWWTSAFDHRKKTWITREEKTETYDGVRHVLLKGVGYTRNISLRRFVDHRLIARTFQKRAPEFARPDIIVSSLPPYDVAHHAVEFGRSIGVPTVVDLRDEWPDLFVDRVPGPLKPVGRLLLSTEFAMVKKTLRQATALTAMMDSMLSWGLGHAARTRSELDRVFPVGAMAAPALPATLSPKIAALKTKLAGKFVVVYVGTFGVYADPRYLLASAAELANDDVAFVFAGEGPLLPEMKERSRDLNNVFYPGWLSSKEMYELLSLSHLGVCPNTSPRDALPNKAFTLFSMGLPVACFLQGDIESLIKRHNLGYCFAPGDDRSFTTAVRALAKSPAEHERMRANVKQIFEDYRADKIYANFADYVEELADSNAGRA